jgi:hypothetical protein
MRQILDRLCGSPVRHGKHPTYRSPFNDNEFTYGYHDNREIRGAMVRRILVVDVGLDVERAREEAR